MLSCSGVRAEDVLKSPKWPAQYPFSAKDFRRQDESVDTIFYDTPRLVLHIGECCRVYERCIGRLDFDLLMLLYIFVCYHCIVKLFFESLALPATALTSRCSDSITCTLCH
jgi:hypothetical protein